MNSTAAGNKIIEIASKFVGLVEIKPNMLWDDPSTQGKDASAQELLNLLRSTKWPEGQPYCAAYAEAVVLQAYRNLNAPIEFTAQLAVNFTPSVVITYRNFMRFNEIDKDAIPGAVFFWEKGHSGLGHAGIVLTYDGFTMTTIEGNTSRGSTGTVEQQRNGDGIYRRERRIDRIPAKGKMWLRGFWNPKGWER